MAGRFRLFTIGFTKSSAERFFARLRDAGVRRVVDVRLRNRSQLAGFAKHPDLAWLLRELAGIDYVHEPRLAPTSDILDAYKKNLIDWAEYERRFGALLQARGVVVRLELEPLRDACLLCSEASPERCHRRLVAEALAAHHAGTIDVIHL